jgi:hypothetical protein
MSALKTVLDSKAAMTVFGVVAVSAVLYYVATKVVEKLGGAAGSVANSVNPTSDKNLVYRGVNQVGEVLTGDASFSLGSWLYDKFNPPYDPNQKDFAPRKLEVRKESAAYDYLAGNG